MIGWGVSIRKVAVKNDISQVDKLVLRPHDPMISQCILQTSADHPAGIRFGMMSSFTVGRANCKNYFLFVVQITNGETTCYVGKPSSKALPAGLKFHSPPRVRSRSTLLNL